MSRIIAVAAIVAVECGLATGGAIDLDDPAEPWRAAKKGVTSDVPPPFEALKRDGSTVVCWGRSYELTGLFPEKIVSAGRAILAGSVTLTAKLRDGTAVLPQGR